MFSLEQLMSSNEIHDYVIKRFKNRFESISKQCLETSKETFIIAMSEILIGYIRLGPSKNFNHTIEDCIWFVLWYMWNNWELMDSNNASTKPVEYQADKQTTP